MAPSTSIVPSHINSPSRIRTTGLPTGQSGGCVGRHFFLSWGSLFHDDSCLCRGDVQTSQGTLCAWRQRAGGRLPGSTTFPCSLAAGPRTELERQLTKRSNLPLSVDTTQCWNPVHLQTHPTFNVCAGDSNTGSRLAHQVILHIQPSYSVLLATEVGM